jgi:anti-anti-sigma regulatory factor
MSPIWRHTLVLTGGLHPGSVSELQEEIECLYQEGVTSLVVDLEQLDAIDLVAIQAIACLAALYKRRGIAVEVTGGSPVVRRAMSEAETANEPKAPRRFTRITNNAQPGRSTKVVRAL